MSHNERSRASSLRVRNVEYFQQESDRPVITESKSMTTEADKNRNVLRFIDEQARLRPRGVALHLEERSYTFAELHENVQVMASAFIKLGVRQGDTVCLVLPNCADFILAWFALARIGAITVPVNGEYAEDRLARLIATVDAEIVVVDSRYDENLAGALSRTCKVRTVIRRGPYAQLGSCHTIALDDFLSSGSDEVPITHLEADDPFMLIFTSGSTGHAKAVEISHGRAEFGTTVLARHLGYRSDDVLFTCFPLFHGDAALMTVLPAVVLGCTAAVVERFSASRFWDQVRRTGATIFTAMGAVQGILLAQPENSNDRNHTVRLAVAGMVHDRVHEFEDRFGFRLKQVYGGTEFGLVAFNHGDPAPGILGKPSDDYDVIVADENDQVVPTGIVGQILIRPRVPNGMMNGYYGDYAETSRVLRNLWYHTGDLAYTDEAGVLHFSGRAKDVIRRRGRMIPPAEIETIFREQPDVHDCVAIGVPSELIEEDVKVVVELTPGTTADLHDIAGKASGRLPRYMRPRYIDVIAEIPKTPTGKPDKPLLRRTWRTPTTIDLENGARTQGIMANDRTDVEGTTT